MPLPISLTMAGLVLAVVFLLVVPASGGSVIRDFFLSYPTSSRFSVGADIEAGIGKTRDRIFAQPWKATGSARLNWQLRLFRDYGLVIHGGYAYFADQPTVITLSRQRSYRAELTVHEVTVGLSQVARPFGFLWMEQGLVVAFPVDGQYDLYESHLAGNGWTDYELYSSEELEGSSYYRYPLFSLTHGIGLDISRFWRGDIPLSLFFRHELQLNTMYLGDNLFAGIGKEQIRLCWGLRGMPFNWGKPVDAAPSSLSPDRKRHNLELSATVAGGLGNLQSVREDPRFHLEETARASIGVAYVHNSRFRARLDVGYEFRQYTESEFTYRSPYSWDDPYRDDYFHHLLSYLGAEVWLECFPVPYVVTGTGVGLSWLLPFGNCGWRYLESGTSGAMVKETVSDAHEYYDYTFDPAILLKCGTPLYCWSRIPLELAFVFRWGWRTPEISTSLYRVTRPTYVSVSLAIAYVYQMRK